jgi:hypothetical protein
MTARQIGIALAIIVLFSRVAAAQSSAPRSSDVAAFIGTWALTMIEPDELKGTEQTVRIWDEGGTLAASIQVGKFPANNVTGILKDGDMLVLTIRNDAPRAIRENGVPIWAVITLTLDGDIMRVAQTLERSRTIKRGAGKKMPN